jgi:hypothetical protein
MAIAKSSFATIVGLLAFVACGDNNYTGAECGTGTMLVDGICVADPGLECGTGTTLVDGQCVANPGLECGTGTIEMNGACITDPAIIDRDSPLPVAGLVVAVNTGTFDVSWTNPAAPTSRAWSSWR